MKKVFVKPELQVMTLRLEERIATDPGPLICNKCGLPIPPETTVRNSQTIS